jgi:hypothetical protein
VLGTTLTLSHRRCFNRDVYVLRCARAARRRGSAIEMLMPARGVLLALLMCTAAVCAPKGGGGGDKGGACADFDDRTAAVNDECCDEKSEDCSSGRPTTCNLGCAHVLLPFFDDCAGALGADGLAPFTDVVVLCQAAEVVG